MRAKASRHTYLPTPRTRSKPAVPEMAAYVELQLLQLALLAFAKLHHIVSVAAVSHHYPTPIRTRQNHMIFTMLYTVFAIRLLYFVWVWDDGGRRRRQ